MQSRSCAYTVVIVLHISAATKMMRSMGSAILVFLFTVLLLIHSAACFSSPTCSLSVTSCQLKEMKFRLAEAINLTNKVAQTLEGAEETRCSPYPEDCEAVYKCGSISSGVYTVWPRSRVLKTSIQVFCDMETAGGGWTVIQRRGDFGNAPDYFFNDWAAYKAGFGDVSQDFWLGNDFIFAITNQKQYSLRFDLADLTGETRRAQYDYFWVDSEDYNYNLHVRGYTGTAGDSFSAHNDKQFTTKDRDNDHLADENCAVKYKGAWWHNNCHISNLNGFYLNGQHTSFADGVEWNAWHGYNYSLPFAEMKIRSIFFETRNDVKTPL